METEPVGEMMGIALAAWPEWEEAEGGVPYLAPSRRREPRTSTRTCAAKQLSPVSVLELHSDEGRPTRSRSKLTSAGSEGGILSARQPFSRR